MPVLSAYYFTMFDNSAKLYYNYYTCIICMFVLFSCRLTSSLIKIGPKEKEKIPPKIYNKKIGSSMVSKSSSFGPCSGTYFLFLTFCSKVWIFQHKLRFKIFEIEKFWVPILTDITYGCFAKPQYFCWLLLGILFIRKIICSANSAYWIGLIHLFFFNGYNLPFLLVWMFILVGKIVYIKLS